VQQTGCSQGGREGGLVVSLKKEEEGNGAQEKG
jgi:hypothetical protein